MHANYHTHSKWCHHGSGEISDFIKEAIKGDCSEIAITEHVPHTDSFSWMSMEEFYEFDKDLNRCIKEYSDRIRIIKGFECEYIPGLQSMDLYKRFRDEYGYELFILGQHVCGDVGEHNIFKPKGPEVLKIYFENVVEGLKTGSFHYLAHPDVCLVDYEPGWDDICENGMKRVFEVCQDMNIPIEINANGIRGAREYPSYECFMLSKDYNLRYYIGSDAHNPKELNDEYVRKAENLALMWGIEVEEYLDI